MVRQELSLPPVAERRRRGPNASDVLAWLAPVSLLLALAGCDTQRGAPDLSLESRLRLAQTLDSGQGADATATVAVLKEAVTQRPRDAALREQLAAASDRAGTYDEAAQAMREAVALQGPSLPRLMALGRSQLRAGDPAAAAESFAAASRLAPGNVAALGGLGLARDMAGDQPAAQAAYRSALALAPQDWAIRSNLALSLIISGQARPAADILADAEFAPAAPKRARHNLALALAATGRADRATRLLRLDMGPAEAEAMTQELTAVARRLDPSLPDRVAALPQVQRRPQRVAAAAPGPRSP